MTVSCPFVVNVSDLMRRPGAYRDVHLSGRLDLRLDQLDRCSLIEADLRIEETGGGILIRGTAKASMSLRCNRCLRQATFDAAAPVRQAYARQAYDEVQVIDSDGAIDLSSVLHDELSLAVPLVPLCSESCRGLCPICGNDLNVEPCEGHFEASASPFAALEGLLESPSASPSQRKGKPVHP